MYNFMINFAYPFLLLLIVPGIGVLIYFYFSAGKRYRNTRNRIASIAIGSVVVLLSTFLMSGMTFDYQVKNNDNELIMVVDNSYSSNSSNHKKNEFVKSVIDNIGDIAKLGIITFAGEQIYTHMLSYDVEGAYDSYIASDLKKTNSTNLAESIAFAHGKFSDPQKGKILLITDGLQTDGDVMSEISKVAFKGIKIDVMHFPNTSIGSEVMPIEVILPDNAIQVGKKNNIELMIKSSIKSNSQVTMYDNGVPMSSQIVSLSDSISSVYFEHSFADSGLHELMFDVQCNDDNELNNNALYSYVNIETFDKILILERDNESQDLNEILHENDVTVGNISRAPNTLDKLRQYDQVILMNISNADMPIYFMELLTVYVSEYGGGLLVVGGMKMVNGKKVPNVYDREDMSGSDYENLLPVLAEDYTPPIAVMLVIDTSGSMGATSIGGKTLHELAKQSAKDAVDALDDRDYLGVVQFATRFELVIGLTPVVEKEKIKQAIDNIIPLNGGTVLTGALEYTGTVMDTVTHVNRKHTIIITDGDASDSSTYLTAVENNYFDNITTSVIGFNHRVIAGDTIANAGGGEYYLADDGDELTQHLVTELTQSEIRDFELGTYSPAFGEYSSMFDGITESDMPTLDGFHGVRLKDDARALIIGDFGQPIYADWSFGKGKVGSFMTDLSGDWSRSFINSKVGKDIISTVVNSLFPKENLRKPLIEIDLKIENFTITATASTVISEGEKLEFILTNTSLDKDNIIHSITVDSKSGYERMVFSITQPGIYVMVVNKVDANGMVVHSHKVYHAVSYSQEYNTFLNDSDTANFVSDIAGAGKGIIITSASQVFDGFNTHYNKSFCPRIIFAVMIVLLLLFDVAARKFKLKMPNKLLKEARERKQKDEGKEDGYNEI